MCKMFMTRHDLLAILAFLTLMGYVCAATSFSDLNTPIEEKLVERRGLGENDKQPDHPRGILVKRKGRSGDPKQRAQFTALILDKLTKKIDLQFKDLTEMVSGVQKFNIGIINRRIDTIIRVQKRATGARAKIVQGFPTAQVTTTVAEITLNQEQYLNDIDQKEMRAAPDPNSFGAALTKVQETRNKVVDGDNSLVAAAKNG